MINLPYIYDEAQFSREQQIGVYNKEQATCLEALDNCLMPSMAAAEIEMAPIDTKMAIYYLETIVTSQDQVIKYLLARDNERELPRRRWWGRKK